MELQDAFENGSPVHDSIALIENNEHKFGKAAYAFRFITQDEHLSPAFIRNFPDRMRIAQEEWKSAVLDDRVYRVFEPSSFISPRGWLSALIFSFEFLSAVRDITEPYAYVFLIIFLLTDNQIKVFDIITKVWIPRYSQEEFPVLYLVNEPIRDPTGISFSTLITPDGFPMAGGDLRYSNWNANSDSSESEGTSSWSVRKLGTGA